MFTRAERIRLNLELFRSLTNKLSDPMEKITALSFCFVTCTISRNMPASVAAAWAEATMSILCVEWCQFLELFRSLTNKLSDPMEKITALSFNESAYRKTANEVSFLQFLHDCDNV
jgi:hypothetical protein